VFGRVYLVPVFLVFPIAFALNRLGQHYAIDPTDPAKWGSILKPSRFWDFWYLSSAYHLEHHYFPGVPFYKLRRLHFALRPFFDEIGWKPVTYRQLVKGWLLDNKAPHTDWHLEG
jgi:fatty acid desaturase